MAGGAGTRLWPMSRKDRPKQLIRFIAQSGAKEACSLLEMAAARLDGLIDPANRTICTAEAYREAIRRDLPQYSDKQILGEPLGRDTVNAVGFAAAVVAKRDPEGVFAVLTADHVIEPADVFRARMDLGFKLVEADPGRLVTFSIKPTYPATGFGYVERGAPIGENGAGGVKGAAGLAFQVARFVEKPDLPRAQAYVQAGHFGWNSGMFVWKASTFLEALRRFKPESHAGMMEIQRAWGTATQDEVLQRVYPQLPKISVDFAVMEPVAAAIKAGDRQFSICTVMMDLNWLDVGSWPSFAQTVAADGEGLRATGPGRAVSVGGRNNLIVTGSPGHTVALLGCEDMIVVQTDDATLVMPRARAEQLKDLHGKLEEKLR